MSIFEYINGLAGGFEHLRGWIEHLRRCSKGSKMIKVWESEHLRVKYKKYIYILSLTLPKMLKSPSAQRFVGLVPQNVET